MEWFDAVATTGHWWEPAFWETEEYAKTSPWQVERLRPAFEGLKRLYAEDETREAFAWVRAAGSERDRLQNRPLWRLLACPMRADLSALARFGLDIVDGDLFSQPELVRKLREDIPREFKGARFELRCLAAFRNAGVDVKYEPLANDEGPNPDFRIHLPQHLYVDAKYAEEGEWVKEEQQWFYRLSMRHDPKFPGIPAHVRLMPRFQELQDTEDGRVFLRANIDRLAAELSDAKIRLATSGGPFPAKDIIEGLIEVEVTGAPATSTSGSVIGVPTDGRREVARVVRGVVAKWAPKIPRDEVGVVLLNPGMRAPSDLLVAEVTRWLAGEGEGADYPNLIGVLVLSELIYEPVPTVMDFVEVVLPVWREGAPDWAVQGPWQALSLAFAWQGWSSLAKRCDEVDPTGAWARET